MTNTQHCISVMRDLSYLRKAGNDVARIYTKKEGINFHRHKDWGEFFLDWGEFFLFMAQNIYLMEKNFKSIADYIRE